MPAFLNILNIFFINSLHWMFLNNMNITCLEILRIDRLLKLHLTHHQSTINLDPLNASFFTLLMTHSEIKRFNLVLQGCSSPIVVKFADTQKEKEAKKLQQINQNLWNISAGGVTGFSPQYITVSIWKVGGYRTPCHPSPNYHSNT